MSTPAPARAEPAEAGVPCGCGAPPHPRLPGRCVRGHAVRGSEIARRHGLHASRLVEAVKAEREAFWHSSVADDGGETAISTRRRSLHTYRARLHVQILMLGDAIERWGLFDRRGRLRVTWLARLEGLIARAAALDAVLGLERRPRRVDSPLAWLEGRAADDPEPPDRPPAAGEETRA